MEVIREFKGVWIPREIWLAEDLGWTAKMLLVEIDSLSANGECFASNDYLAKFFNVSKDRISKLITELKRAGYIEVELAYKENTRQVDRRIISPIPYRQKYLYPIGENADTPIGENAYDINTGIINTSDIYGETPKQEYFEEETPSSTSKKRKCFIKPTVEEITAYCLERGNTINPQQFYNYYEARGWYIGKNKMVSWKNAVCVWEGNEKKFNPTADKPPQKEYEQW